MVNKIIYLEGGGDSKELHTRCREGFSKLLERAGFKGRMPRLVACGGRGQTYSDFVTAHESGQHQYVALWIDSEEPLKDLENAWTHLNEYDKWDNPEKANDEQVLFMATCMETWITADRATVKAHYGHKLQESALPPLNDLENRPRHDVQDRLTRATRNCTNAYAKGKRSFDLLGKLDPEALKPYLPSLVRTLHILNQNL